MSNHTKYRHHCSTHTYCTAVTHNPFRAQSNINAADFSAQNYNHSPVSFLPARRSAAAGGPASKAACESLKIICNDPYENNLMSVMYTIYR